MNRPNEKKKKYPNPAFKDRPRHHRRKPLPQLSSIEFNRLRGEFKTEVLKGALGVPEPVNGLLGITESVCDMALLMMLKHLGLKNSNTLDLMCGLVPEIMKRYGIEKLPLKAE